MAGSKQVRQEGSLQPQDGAADRRSQAQNKREREGGTTQEADHFEGKKLAPALGEGKVWATQKQELSLSLFHNTSNYIVNSRTEEVTSDVMSASKMSVESIWWVRERMGEEVLVRKNHRRASTDAGRYTHSHTHTQPTFCR